VPKEKIVEVCMAIVYDGKRFLETKYENEKQFEDEVVAGSKLFFGKKSIFINAKKKIDSKSIGATIPDGFFFDFSDPLDPQLYLVEIELAEHGFFKHIFPQITKFFAFFKNTSLQKSLVDKLFHVIQTDDLLKAEFKKHLKNIEIHKFLSDMVESSQNILLIADRPINEMQEIMYTYTDTWGKLVRYLEIKKYLCEGEVLYLVHPDLETLQYSEAAEQSEEEVDDEARPVYTEQYHLDGVKDQVAEVYRRTKALAAELDKDLVFNPQKYYISIKAGKNIAFLKLRVKKLRFIAMLPETEIRKIVSKYPIASLSQPVQNFYNGPCAAVEIDNLEHEEEIKALIARLLKEHKGT
jgi:predicted transport protein